MDIIVSVSLRIISCFWAGVKTSSISFTSTKGIGFLRSYVLSRLGDTARTATLGRAPNGYFMSANALSAAVESTRSPCCLLTWAKRTLLSVAMMKVEG